MANSENNIDFTINVNNDDIKFYTAGSTITGTLVLKLSKDMAPILTITVIFSGSANVKFNTLCDSQTRYFNNSKTIFIAEQKLWDCHDHQPVTSGLSAGVYKFPFAFQLPSKMLPSSWEMDQDNFVRYSLFAGISQLKSSIFDYITAKKIIHIREMVDINTPNLIAPVSAMQQKEMPSFFQPFGVISLSVGMQRKGYCLGESIAINATAKNQSKKRIIALRASLTQTLITSGTASYHLSSKLITASGSKCKMMLFNQYDFQTTSVDGILSHWDNILLPIPSQSLLPTIKNEFMEVSYTLKVTLVLHKTTEDVSVKIPIVVGTVPFKDQPAVPHIYSATDSVAPIIVSQISKYNCDREIFSPSTKMSTDRGAYNIPSFDRPCIINCPR